MHLFNNIEHLEHEITILQSFLVLKINIMNP